MQLPRILQGEDDEPKSIEEHVEIGIQNLDDQILAAEEEGEDVLASVTRAQGAILLTKLKQDHRKNRSVSTKIDRWIQRELPKANGEHLKQALTAASSDDGVAASNQQGVAADESDDGPIVEESRPTKDIDSLIGEDLRSRLYTRVVSRVMAAYEVEADIPVYKQENDNPGSFLFKGVPGTGKTHGAEGVAWVLQTLGYETGFYPTTGGQIKSSDYGASEQRLEQLLRHADEDGNEISVVFIDEIEDVTSRDGHEATAAIANTLQSLTSGVDVVDSVVVIGATNHPSRVSDAIHNRFTSVEFPEPTREAKEEMLLHHLGSAQEFPTEQLTSLDDELFNGLTGRDMKLAAKEATDNSLLTGDSSGPTSLEEMESVRQELQSTPEVSIFDIKRALNNRQK